MSVPRFASVSPVATFVGWLLALGMLFAGAVFAHQEAGEDLGEAVRGGDYEAAIERLEERLAAGFDRRSLELLVDAWVAVGRYEEAETRLRERLPDVPTLANRLGEVLVLRGERAEAEELFARAVRDGHPDALRAQVNRARLWFERGELERAEEGFFELIEAYNRRSSLTADELVAVGIACQRLGRTDPQLFKDALRAFDEALAADPEALEPRVLIGELFLEKYDSTEARGSIAEVLAVNPSHPDANLAMARILRFDGSSRALELARSVLETNPSHVPARVFVAQLLLELEDFDEAAREARRALEVDPVSLDALAALAAAHYLADDLDAYREVEAQVLELNPRYADFYNRLADASLRTAKYRQARDLARRAVELDARSWQGWHHLGLNQLRLGQIEEGRANLEKAFAGDPYNVWVKNTLDLLDTFPQYHTERVGRFELFVHEKEAAVLKPLVAELAEEAFADMVERYGFEPPTPIRIEVYPSHADFSVRTVGLAGLGALGVCFGPVVAIDSPSARQPGEANWGSTLWHELAHTFTLEITGARVPRWLTEGISVWEERRARAGWGDDVTPEFLDALLDDKLLPMAELNNGFVRPSFPIQIALSYYQGSLVVERIVERFGFQKLVAMLHAYRDGGSTEEVFREVLGVELADFDGDFFAWLEQRFATPLAALERAEKEESAHGEMPAEGAARPTSREALFAQLEENARERPGDFRAQLAWGTYLYANDRDDEAVEVLERARALFPQYASDASPYWMLGELYAKQGRTELAIERLRQLIDVDETSWKGHRKLAELLEETGQAAEAATVLERALYITPLDLELQERRAELWQQAGENERRVAARAAVVALDPPDRAGALLRLAEAQLDAGDRRGARRSVLGALELAPGYDDAQELLLRLVEDESS